MKINKYILSFLFAILLVLVNAKVVFAGFSFSDVSDSSVTISVSNFNPNTNYAILLMNDNTITNDNIPVYNQEVNVKTNNMGQGSVIFSNLSPVAHYMAAYKVNDNQSNWSNDILYITTIAKQDLTELSDTSNLEDRVYSTTTTTTTTSTTSKKGIVPDCTGEDGMCTFDDFMTLINNVINFVLFVLATPLVAIIVAYAGWLYLSSGGSSENVSKAKKILKNAIIGYIIALAAWLIIKTILVTLGFNGTMFLTNY